VKPHIHVESRTCTCGITADEPDEECPVHGAGEWPPRCCVCGCFMSRIRPEPYYMTFLGGSTIAVDEVPDPVRGWDEEPLHFVRASGDCVCDVCGKSYYQHPMAGPLFEGRQWLHRVCNGDLVKL
jgi:hypothetical protein